MSRFSLILIALVIVQVAFALDDPKKGETVLKPTGTGEANKGVSVLSADGTVPAGGCNSENGCGDKKNQTSKGAVAPPPPGFTNAIVIHRKDAGADCGCKEEELDCKCDKPKYVEPEIKHDCGCIQDLECACRELYLRLHHQQHQEHSGSHSSESSHHLHHQVETVAPEQEPRHVKPEVQEKLSHKRACEHVDDCKKEEEAKFTAPELKPDCKCHHEDLACACAGLPKNH